MRRRQEAVLETLRQIQCFLDDNAELLSAVNNSGARKRLDQITAQITAHAIDQVAGRRTSQGETARQRSLRAALRFDHMLPISIIARELLREQPDFKLLRMPLWKVRGPSLTAAARDMANAAEKHTELFVEEGLSSDFVAELRDAAGRLEQSVDARGQGRGQRAGATAGLKAETRRARALIRVLDSLIRPKLGVNDEVLREWQLARHIKRERRAVSATSSAEASSLTATPRLTA